ncbi:NADH-quinone oxidoreductase subunit C [Oxalobacter formigenes]|uniref:NADH-quinone oxidoreductase subunit C n=1 Tax=Oxalobacter formigenes OXCC13 TaxID=556269 RepID=C3XAW6_OXAFO|nr:NADH-quinone oxidoreductase subunit C [Oxalobacter formigenes]ARQ45499.1 NADH-quinone oxidoreductase chain 5 [Oxalobacter formigenes]ARQ77768.1 NADH-quinone oxidoreductase subunit C [Oxalobacter formigenes OXCC13]EEO30342.1 NADH-quinone oxidoreductase chain 5 [Oxalobacter formigenes OXCC13]MCZ4061937.1 NADH-quinone oxidoreductase subunit C [Oxalobacter formigenes]QDX33695.1 NADH-quinone oxidoreductase subunit C [Oxalobacter formigenes]
MRRHPAQLIEILRAVFGERITHLSEDFSEVTLVIGKSDYLDVMKTLKGAPELQFAELIDLCGIDYAGYNNDPNGLEGKRFAVVSHLLSLEFNCRLRVRVFAEDEQMPSVPSIVDIWPSANWFEREAFDLYGILFDGHPDLRRILTDYGFVGHPFRKDFPIQGYVEMRYDEEQKRVVYQPVTIEPREITPRVIRDDKFGRE